MEAKKIPYASRPSIKISAQDERALWQNFRKGNEDALASIYKTYVQRLYNYGMQVCKDHELVMDCLQELFERLWTKRESINEVTVVNFYLLKSFRRLLLNKLILNKKHVGQDFEEYGFELTPSCEDLLIKYEYENELQFKLKECISLLTKRQREVIFLKFFNELTYHEVAAVMNLHVDSVYNLISKAIEALRANFKNVVFSFMLSCLC